MPERWHSAPATMKHGLIGNAKQQSIQVKILALASVCGNGLILRIGISTPRRTVLTVPVAAAWLHAAWPGPILVLVYVFHPVDVLAVQRLVNGDVRHGSGSRGPVPVLFAGREPDHVA
jgi:hypothetical protein